MTIGNGTKAGTFQYGKNLSDVKVLESSTAIGNKATALTGTSLGYNTKSDLLGVAIGSSASAMYGGVAIGSGSKIVRDTYSTYREKGVALGNKSVVDRRFGTYGYMPLSNTAATLQTPDSMENDIALAKQTGDANVIKTVNDFYTNYGEDTYNKWKELKTASRQCVYMLITKKLAEINSKGLRLQKLIDWQMSTNCRIYQISRRLQMRPYHNFNKTIKASPLRSTPKTALYQPLRQMPALSASVVLLPTHFRQSLAKSPTCRRYG
mgnify:CR=1 FL=1